MATYVNNLRLKEITTGDEDGTWGTSTNTNLELIGEGFGYGTQEVAADANETFTMADGAADGVRAMYLKFTSAGSLSATRTLTLAPNTVSKVWIIENATTGSQIITIKQGAGATINIASGAKKMVYTDGAGSGAAVFDANTTVGTAATITVANEATDTTCFPAFFTAATGDLGPKSNTGLTYNSATNALGVGILTVGNLQTLSTGADIASATATDLTAATGNVVVITGTATATSLTMTAGQQMVLLPSAAWPLTYHATTMNITGGVSYTCAAGDRIYAVKDLAGVIRVSVFKQDGTAVVAGSGTPAVVIETTTALTMAVDTQVTFTNAGLTTITLPASPSSGDLVWITPANSLTTNIIARNGSTIMDLAQDLTIDVAKATVRLRYTDSSWRLV
jgi:hypothetical protein